MNPAGPFQLYVDPAVDIAFRVNLPPWQGLVAVTTGITGVGFTVTVMVVEELHPVDIFVMVTLYTPDALVCTLVIVGLMAVEVKPLGPVQL